MIDFRPRFWCLVFLALIRTEDDDTPRTYLRLFADRPTWLHLQMALLDFLAGEDWGDALLDEDAEIVDAMLLAMDACGADEIAEDTGDGWSFCIVQCEVYDGPVGS